MTESERDFWQREAVRFESNVMTNMTRTYALIGVGLTGLASVAVGTALTELHTLSLLIPVIILLIFVMALPTIQEVLVKALYQYQAETNIAEFFPAEEDRQYLTWEDYGGRLGNRSGTTVVFWISAVAMATFLSVCSVVYYLSKEGGIQAAAEKTLADGKLTAFTIAAVMLFTVVALGNLLAFLRMFTMFNKLKEGMGYRSGSWPTALAELRLRSSEAPAITRDDSGVGLMAHPEAAIDRDDSA